MRDTTICILGLGPWGLCVLERIISRARHTSPQTDVSIHIIERGEPGVGVHYRSLPEYLLLNTKCGHVSMFIEPHFPDIEAPTHGPTLLEWAHDQGYRISDDGYALKNHNGREITADDFLPRHLLGEYMHWFYQSLIKRCPRNISIKRHTSTAINITPNDDGSENVLLDSGESIATDFIFLTTGHTKTNKRVTRELHSGEHIEIKPQYPLAENLTQVKPREKIAIAGFGLVAIDVLTTLTFGRGGKFVVDPESGKKVYQPGGDEPRIYMFSRSGAAYCSRPAISKDPAQFGYNAEFFTLEQIDTLRQRRHHQHGDTKLDIVKDVLPILWDEMKMVYYETSVLLTEGEQQAERVRRDLVSAWHEGRFNEEANKLATRFPPFDPENYVRNPLPGKFKDSAEYQDMFSKLIELDLAEAYKGEIQSPYKAALELFRVLRGVIRYAVDFAGLVPESQIDFSKRVAAQINRVIVGPPKERLEELLALIDAGVVHIPFGPNPDILLDPDNQQVAVRSTALGKPVTEYMDKICYAHLGHPSVEHSLSPLLSALYREGRVKPFRIEDAVIGGIHIDRNLHPLNQDGDPEQRIFVLGPLTEGIRYFNHYIPSPTSRILAFRDADNCVQQVLKYSGRNSRHKDVSVTRVAADLEA